MFKEEIWKKPLIVYQGDSYFIARIKTDCADCTD